MWPPHHTGYASTTVDDHVYHRLLEQRIVLVGSTVDDEVADRVVAQMLLLAAEDPAAEIRLYLNCPGGSAIAGMAVYDTMRHIELDVSTWAVGLVASVGQFLLSAGTPGRRYALPHARIAMCQPSAGTGGTASDVRIGAEVFGALKKEIADLTAQHTGQPVRTVNADADRGRWFTAAEARDYGIVDHVVAAR